MNVEALEKQLRKIRYMMGFTIFGLGAIAIIAFPVVTNIQWLDSFAGNTSPVADITPALANWISTATAAVVDTNALYPFLFYMSDWMVFSHVIIALFFIGPFRDPVKNIWVIQVGLAACILVIPTALIAGSIRGIPFFWQLMDCGFSVICFPPMYLALRWTKQVISATSNG